MPDVRESVCQAIASLHPGECRLEDVKRALDPFFAQLPELDDSIDGTISPLIVACDKGNLTCLEYLAGEYKEETASFIGKPLDSSKCDKNTSMHHAAMSGCFDAISILRKMGKETIISLGSVENSHGDTPIMMAATSGQADFCKRWFDMAVEESGVEAVCDVLRAANDSNDTALSLACSHGHLELVDFLLSCDVFLEQEQFDKCRTSYKRMESALHSNPGLLKQYKNKLDSVNQCIKRVEAILSIRAEETAHEMLIEDQASRSNSSRKSKQKREKKSKRKQGRFLANSKLDTTDQWFPSKDSSVQVESELMHLTTLADGKMAVRVSGTISENERLPALMPPPPSQSTDELFRERFQSGASEKVEAVMDALCLDVSMLLYTPHGMALNLSPSQLDAVHNILLKQMEAVQQARDIQNRMHKTSSGNDDTS